MDKFRAESQEPSASPFARALQIRAYEKCERVAGVLAVWDNPHNPLIDVAHVAWSEQLLRASDSAALHFCGEYMHGGQVQADAALLKRTMLRLIKGDIATRSIKEAQCVKGGDVPRAALLKASKLDKRRFDEAISHLIALEEVEAGCVEGAQSNGKKFVTRVYSLTQDGKK